MAIKLDKLTSKEKVTDNKEISFGKALKSCTISGLKAVENTFASAEELTASVANVLAMVNDEITTIRIDNFLDNISNTMARGLTDEQAISLRQKFSRTTLVL